MRQTIALTLLIVALVLTRGPLMAQLTERGNWGSALGILFGAVFGFYAVLGLLYYGRRLFGRSGASFTTTRLNYLSLGLALAISLAAPPPT